tara:strand:+ start:1726 stop:2739 length:1014 start_codon:yes stop_codon:yes gene_type:complete
MNKKNLIIILSHCDNSEKVEILKNILNEIKSEGFDILLTSHIPLSTKIQSMVDYLVYDKSNPILFWPERGMTHWRNNLPVGDQIYKMHSIFPEYGWTALNQILTSSHLGLSLDYDHYTFINYDTVLTPSLIEAMKNPQDLYLSTNDNEGIIMFPSLLFNILSKSNLRKILPLISKENYINGRGDKNEGGNFRGSEHQNTTLTTYRDAEHYFFNLVNNFTYLIHPEILEHKACYKPLEERDGIDAFNFNIYGKTFEIFMDSTTSDLIIYNLINPIDFKINDKLVQISENYFINSEEITPLTSLGYYDYDGEFVDLLPLTKKIKLSAVDRFIENVTPKI